MDPAVENSEMLHTDLKDMLIQEIKRATPQVFDRSDESLAALMRQADRRFIRAEDYQPRPGDFSYTDQMFLVEQNPFEGLVDFLNSLGANLDPDAVYYYFSSIFMALVYWLDIAYAQVMIHGWDGPFPVYMHQLGLTEDAARLNIGWESYEDIYVNDYR